MDTNASVVRTFVEWIKVKIKVHLSDRAQSFSEGEIWWVSLGQNVGTESNGKSANFERPALIIKKFNKDSFWGIPISTQIKEGRYYYSFILKDRKYCLNLSQLRLLSSKRMLRHINMLSQADFYVIRQRMKDFF